MTTVDEKYINDTMEAGPMYSFHPKLSQDCRVQLENIVVTQSEQPCQVQNDLSCQIPSTVYMPISMENGKITVRRASVRLLEKYRHCWKETPARKVKKKPKAKNLLKDLSAIEDTANKIVNNEKSFDTTNISHYNNQNEQFPDLSGEDIEELLNQMTCFIENGVFGEDNMNWNNDSDLNLLHSARTVASSSSSFPVQDIPYASPCLDNIGALDLTIHKVKSTTTVVNPNAFKSSVSDDTKFSKIFPMDHDVNSMRSTVSMSRTVFTQTETSTHHDSSIEPVTSTTASETIENSSTSEIISTETTHSMKKKKRRTTKPCQIYIQNYDLNKCTIKRKLFKFKIPKLKKARLAPNDSAADQIYFSAFQPESTKTEENTVSEKTTETSKISTAITHTVSTQTSDSLTSKLPALEKPHSNFVSMKLRVIRLLKRPCFKFLRNEDCGLYCQYNHLLPSSTTVAEDIKDWSTELIHFFYISYIQQNVMCYIMYFQVICDIFVERRLVFNILATVKDCERLSLEYNFKTIFMGLMQLGYSQDEALFAICASANRTLSSMNVILEIMTSFQITNFARTIAFISHDIENHDIKTTLANEILRQACDADILGELFREFCFAIVRKTFTKRTLNKQYLKLFLQKNVTKVLGVYH